MPDYGYLSEKFAAARSCLMLPHSESDAQAIAHAFQACELGLRVLRVNELEETQRNDIATVMQIVNTDGVVAPDGRGTWFHKAASLTMREQEAFSRAIDSLASFFARSFWSKS